LYRPTRIIALSVTMLGGCLCGTALWATHLTAHAAPLPGALAPARSSAAAGPSGSRWVPTALGEVGARKVTVSDINDRGQVVGSLTTTHGGRGFVWKNGSMKDLGNGSFAGASRINERGQIIGTSSAAHRAEHAVQWKNGKMKDLGFTFVTALNERDQIVGARFVSLGGGVYGGAPVIWASGKVRDLFGLAGRGGQASAINNRGHVVGTTRNGRAVLWQNGKITDLGPGTAVDINERGQIIGYTTTPAGKSRAFLWQNGARTDLGPGALVAINGRGQVIGYRESPAGELNAFLWQRGTTTDLGTLGGAWSFPTAISNRGQVVGYSTDRSGVQHAFVWQNGTMTGLPSPTGSARTRAIAINEHNQIIGDNCYWDCDHRSGPLSGSKFGVLWTLHRVARNGRRRL
jgi:probable HAF family extracellular repeat protein